MSNVTNAGSGLRYVDKSGVTVASSTTETACTGFTIPEYVLKAGSVIRFIASGQATCTSTPNLLLKVNFGGSAVLTHSLTATSFSSTAWVWEGCLTVQSSVALMGYSAVRSSSAYLTDYACDVTADTIDTTVAGGNLVTLSFTWDANSASNTITASQIVFWVEE